MLDEEDEEARELEIKRKTRDECDNSYTERFGHNCVDSLHENMMDNDGG